MYQFIIDNKDIIAPIVSSIALVLSFYNFLYALFCKRCKVKIIVHNHYFSDKTHQFFVTIQNCSQLPISISSLQINRLYSCVLEPTLVKENIRRSGKEIISRVETKTIPFPINLNSLESRSGYLEFRNIENFDINNFSLSIFTNRRNIKNVKIINYDDLSK